MGILIKAYGKVYDYRRIVCVTKPLSRRTLTHSLTYYCRKCGSEEYEHDMDHEFLIPKEIALCQYVCDSCLETWKGAVSIAVGGDLSMSKK